MSIIVDGYNLLCCAGIVADSRGPYTLEKSRRGLLGFLSRVLSPEELRETTVVFDAKDAPANLPRFHVWNTVQVVFAEPGQEADDVIVELVEQHTAAKQLMVVSSDHVVQRAARRRRAKFSDSDVWFQARVRQLRSRQKSESHGNDSITAKIRSLRHEPLSAEEVAQWLAEFDNDIVDQSAVSTPKAKKERPSAGEPQPIWNPFPEGYAEDLLDEDP